MYLSELRIWNFRKFDGDEKEPGLHIKLNPGLNLLVGENDSGKTAIVDAIKFVLLTQSYEYYKLEDEDFHILHNVENDKRAKELKIECVFRDFAPEEAANFLEWLSFEKDEGGSSKYYLRVVLKARRENGRIYRDIRAGHEEQGSLLDEKARDLLRVVYLKPLRDVELELSPRKNSRLAQVLHSHKDFADKENHPLKKAINEANCLIEGFFKCESIVPSTEEVEVDEEQTTTGDDQSQPIPVSSTDEGDEEAIRNDTRQNSVEAPKTQVLSQINYLLEHFSSKNRALKSNISISDMSLKAILEKLSLAVDSNKVGLGSNNLLFIATELLLLQKEKYNGLKLTLIEEVEAHLHPQAQLRLIDFLQAEIQQNGGNIQLILTTHSPNLASKVKLESLIVCKNGKVFNMGPAYTKLEKGDYLFLERFLDVTKANLFFAEGVILVEGDAENILIPTIAEIIDLPLSRYGVSVVNVGSTAFLRYSRIFQRKSDYNMDIPVSIITDCDVRPNEYYTVAKEELPEGEYSERIKAGIEKKELEYKEIPIEPFVSPFWTLEYVIALSGLKKEFYTAVLYAQKIENSNPIGLTPTKEANVNSEVESNLKAWKDQSWTDEKMAFEIYYNIMLRKSNANSKPTSKAIVAQCFAKIIAESPKEYIKKILVNDKTYLKYLVDAIRYATSQKAPQGE